MFLRKFIIMSKQSSKDVKGHARLEVRGVKARLSLSLEGIKFKEDIDYELLALTDEKSGFKQVVLGKVDVSSSGKGRFELSFNSNSVIQSQKPISEFNILLLNEKNIQKNENQVILGGYIHQDDNSMSKGIKQIKGLEKIKKVEIKEEIKAEVEEIEQVEPVKQVELEEKPDFESSIDPQADGFEGKDIKQESREVEEIEQVEEIKQKQDHKVITEQEKIEKENNFKDYNDHVARYTLDLLKFFKEVEPFKISGENQRWWQIDYDKTNSKLGFLPYYSYISNSPYGFNIKADYATCQSQIKKYKKYLFGVAADDEKITHYIYAIPGKRVKSEHPYGGSTGFVTWLEDKDGEGDGYWLSYINACTGNIVRPI